jgi:glycosyltransferase involved in cell wall biosynthesis
MNICYVNSTFGINDYRGGGLKTHLLTMPFEMAKNGHKVTILTSGKGRTYFKNNVKIIELCPLEFYSNFIQLINPIFIFNKLVYMYRVSKYLSSSTFDAVEFADTGFEQLFCFFTKHPPIITRLHGSFSDVRPSKINTILYLLEKFILAKSDYLVSPSASYAEYCRDKYKINRKIKIIPYGIYTNIKYKKVNITKKYGIGKRKIILFVGMLSKRKGVGVFLNTAKKLYSRKDIVFVMLGGNLENYDTSRFPENVIYLGHKEKDELKNFYKESTLLFSPTRFETFGLNIIEAMSYGKPVVVSDTIGVKDIVKNYKNGFLLKLGDSDEASQKILKIIDNSTLQKRIGVNNMELAQQYNIKKIAKDTERYYINCK